MNRNRIRFITRLSIARCGSGKQIWDVLECLTPPSPESVLWVEREQDRVLEAIFKASAPAIREVLERCVDWYFEGFFES